MKQATILILASAIAIYYPICASQSPKPGFSISMPNHATGSAIKTSHAVEFDSKAFGEALERAFSQLQIGLNPTTIAELKKLIDPKVLGELVEKFKIVHQDLKLDIDFKKLGEAFASVKINIDEKSLKEFVGSKEVQETLHKFKLIPDNITFNEIKFRLEALPTLPVNLALHVAERDGWRMVGTAGGIMATASMLTCGVGCVNSALLCGSAAAISPERARAIAAMICNEHSATKVKNCCIASGQYAQQKLSACANSIRNTIKPSSAPIKRD